MPDHRFPRLHPAQVCFVVASVDAAVAECVGTFGWGPFHRFTAPVEEARYRDWTGSKRTDVALGMAGDVQVELLHVHEGHDTVEAYQARYGVGVQHMGINCRDRERAIAALEEIGARVDDRGEYPGVRFAFVDTPTGPGMFELLQMTGDTPPPGDAERHTSRDEASPTIELDRATIVTDDLDRVHAFYSRAFRWEGTQVESCTLRVGSAESRHRRVRGKAGQLLLELIEADSEGDDPYARHLARGDHGLVHAGGISQSEELFGGASLEAEWLESGEQFELLPWSGGAQSLQVRRSTA